MAYVSIRTNSIEITNIKGTYPADRLDIEAYFAPPGGIAKARMNRLASIQASTNPESLFGFSMLRGRSFAENKVPIVLWGEEGDFAECILTIAGRVPSIEDFCTANSIVSGVLVVRYPLSREHIRSGRIRDMRVLKAIDELVVSP
jgi:hypothetical protein